jgi:hypothetical protein
MVFFKAPFESACRGLCDYLEALGKGRKLVMNF